MYSFWGIEFKSRTVYGKGMISFMFNHYGNRYEDTVSSAQVHYGVTSLRNYALNLWIARKLWPDDLDNSAPDKLSNNCPTYIMRTNVLSAPQCTALSVQWLDEALFSLPGWMEALSSVNLVIESRSWTFFLDEVSALSSSAPRECLLT